MYKMRRVEKELIYGGYSVLYKPCCICGAIFKILIWTATVPFHGIYMYKLAVLLLYQYGVEVKGA